MDVEVFTDAGFNAVEWINHCYDEATATSQVAVDKEVFVSNLVGQLETLVQSVNASLERTSEQVIASMPKIFQNVQDLRAEALGLQRNMSEVQNEISQVQRETGSCMANLERLDKLKTKLQVAKEGLQESDGWGRLTAELEDLFERCHDIFEQGDMNGACEKIAVLQKSLMAQEGLPGQVEREAEVEEAKNKLEALASPHLVKAFTASDVEQSKQFVEIFEKMQREAQLRQYYRTVQRTSLLRQWTEMVELAEAGNSLRFLRDFYELLLEMWNKQTKWCGQVFAAGDEKRISEPTQILVETLSRMEPTREAAIAQALKRTGDKLECLQEMSSANVFLGEMLQRVIDVQERPKEEMVALSRAIFDYFNSFVIQYPAWEQNWLNGQLVLLNMNEATASDSIRVLGSSNPKVVQFLREALKRCEGITRGSAIAPLVTVLNSLLREYLDKYKRAQKQLEASRSVEESWTLIQSCTTLLQNIGEFMMSLSELEPAIEAQVREMHGRVGRQDLSEFTYKILRKAEVNELKRLAGAIEENHEAGSGLFNVFKKVVEETINPICASVHETTLLSIFGPIEGHLKDIAPPEDVMHGEDLPDYSFAPQEYITQVGQYLMTLPQHLEPLLLAPSKALKLALEHSDEKYRKDASCGDVLLAMIAEDTCGLLLENVVKLPELSTGTSKQLATDIDYLGNVLEELCLTLSKTLQQTSLLLRATQENYSSVSAGCEPRLVMTIRQKRSLVIGDN